MSLKQNENCECPNTSCKEHGICSECIKKHNSKQSMVHCVFPDSNGDRSIKHYYEVLKARFND